MADMTNEELLNYPGARTELLTHIEKQKRFLLQQAAKPSPCPNCATPVSQFEATGIAINDWEFHSHEPAAHCPKCRRTLLFTLPWPTGAWHWRLEPVGDEPSA